MPEGAFVRRLSQGLAQGFEQRFGVVDPFQDFGVAFKKYLVDYLFSLPRQRIFLG